MTHPVHRVHFIERLLDTANEARNTARHTPDRLEGLRLEAFAGMLDAERRVQAQLVHDRK